MQVAGIAALSGTGGSFGWTVTVATSLPLVAFFIVNRSVPGTLVVGIGFLLNLVVITLNRAMPVSPDAAQAAGVPITREIQGPRHEVLTEHSLLPWLGDVVPLPPLDTVVSIGDIVLAVGIGYMLFRAALAPRDQGVRTASGSEPAAGL